MSELIVISDRKTSTLETFLTSIVRRYQEETGLSALYIASEGNSAISATIEIKKEIAKNNTESGRIVVFAGENLKEYLNDIQTINAVKLYNTLSKDNLWNISSKEEPSELLENVFLGIIYTLTEGYTVNRFSKVESLNG